VVDWPRQLTESSVVDSIERSNGLDSSRPRCLGLEREGDGVVE